MARREQLWQPYMVRGTIVGAVFGPAGPLAARTTCGVTGHFNCLVCIYFTGRACAIYSIISYMYVYGRYD